MAKIIHTILSKIPESNANVVFLSAILLSIPLKNIFCSVLLIAYFVYSLFLVIFKKTSTSFVATLLLPIGFYILIVASAIWSINIQQTVFSIQKMLPFLAIPLVFLYAFQINEKQRDAIFFYFSNGMVVYSVFYILFAIFRYIKTNQISVFFNHELVNKDLNAIYFSVLVSFALFYFISKKTNTLYAKTAIALLVLFLFMLSSKTVITINIILGIYYYYYFLPHIPRSTKRLTLLVLLLFVSLSVMYVKNVKSKFLKEYETAFVDNTVNYEMGTEYSKIYNVSVHQAWTTEKFELHNFFPGMALRVYQFRIFLEIAKEYPSVLYGFGAEAAQSKIHEKAKQHHLNPYIGGYNFHNQYIQTFAELGLLGFIILCAMLYISFKKAITDKNFVHIVFSITMIVLFLTESFFCRQRGIVFFIVLFCIFNGIKNKPISKQI